MTSLICTPANGGHVDSLLAPAFSTTLRPLRPHRVFAALDVPLDSAFNDRKVPIESQPHLAAMRSRPLAWVRMSSYSFPALSYPIWKEDPHALQPTPVAVERIFAPPRLPPSLFARFSRRALCTWKWTDGMDAVQWQSCKGNTIQTYRYKGVEVGVAQGNGSLREDCFRG